MERGSYRPSGASRREANRIHTIRAMSNRASQNRPSARVFISCGQAESTSERLIADDIARRLTAMGYDPFVAFRVQSLHGLKENIFAQLSASEYVIFGDCSITLEFSCMQPRYRAEDVF